MKADLTASIDLIYRPWQMAKRRGQGRLAGGIGYPGPKRVTTQNYTAGVLATLERNEQRLGASKTALSIYAVRKANLDRCSLADIERDIAAAAEELEATTTAGRKARWAAVGK